MVNKTFKLSDQIGQETQNINSIKRSSQDDSPMQIHIPLTQFASFKYQRPEIRIMTPGGVELSRVRDEQEHLDSIINKITR
jgi:hypothetical protein